MEFTFGGIYLGTTGVFLVFFFIDMAGCWEEFLTVYTNIIYFILILFIILHITYIRAHEITNYM